MQWRREARQLHLQSHYWERVSVTLSEMAGNGSQPLHTHCALKHGRAANCQRRDVLMQMNDDALFSPRVKFCCHTSREKERREFMRAKGGLRKHRQVVSCTVTDQ